jgi:phospholipase C
MLRWIQVEPNHRPPLHIPDHLPSADEPDRSNSQHPGNSLVANEKYDSYVEDDTYVEDAKSDFERGEQLIATVYEILRSNPAVFERSVLLITYDEHGGFYDHEPPPNARPPGDPVSHGRLERFMDWLLRKKGKAFDFTVLGPRVPALVVSPYVPAGTVCDRVRDHASIPATLRELFAPDADPLTERDRYAPPFHSLLTLDRPRAGTDLPDLSKWKQKIPATPEAAEAIAPGPKAPPPDYYRPFYKQAELVGRELNIEPPAGLGPRARARHVTAEFAARANDARAARGSSPPL